MDKEHKILKQNQIIARATIRFHAGKSLTDEQRAAVDRKTIFEKIRGKVTIDNRHIMYGLRTVNWRLEDN